MQILKTSGNWVPPAQQVVPDPDSKIKGATKVVLVDGEGRNEAVFNIEAVGENPDEVLHLASLLGEAAKTTVVAEGGALKIAVTFKRKVTLEQQAKIDAEKVAADIKKDVVPPPAPPVPPVILSKINGTVNGAGAAGTVVALTGSGKGTVTLDASGAYTFPNLPNGTYTLTPGRPGFTFSPATQTVTINGANATAPAFTAVPIPTI